MMGGCGEPARGTRAGELSAVFATRATQHAAYDEWSECARAWCTLAERKELSSFDSTCVAKGTPTTVLWIEYVLPSPEPHLMGICFAVNYAGRVLRAERELCGVMTVKSLATPVRTGFPAPPQHVGQRPL